MRVIRYFLWLIVTMTSTSVIIPTYLIKIEYTFLPLNGCTHIGDNLLLFIHCILYIAVLFLLTELGFLIMKGMAKPDELYRSNGVYENHFSITSLETDFLPIYLSYFFIALSIPGTTASCNNNNVSEMPSWFVLFAVYIILNGLLAISEQNFFNPLLMVCGYRFYRIQVNEQVKISIISKKRIQKDDNNKVEFPNLLKITETVFIDKDK